MSGHLPVHMNDLNLVGLEYNPNDNVSGFAGIPRNMTGLATKLREAGYATHQVGKWDAGFATPDHTPQGVASRAHLGTSFMPMTTIPIWLVLVSTIEKK